MVERLTAAQAASAIVALINARPRTPWLGDIQAIIQRVNAGPEPEGSSLLAVKLRCLMPERRRSIMDSSEAIPGTAAHRAAEMRDRDLHDRFGVLCRQLWATPPATLDDLVVRAEVAQFEALDWPSPYQHWPMLSEPSLEERLGCFEFRQLAIAVLQMGGIRYAV